MVGGWGDRGDFLEDLTERRVTVGVAHGRRSCPIRARFNRVSLRNVSKRLLHAQVSVGSWADTWAWPYRSMWMSYSPVVPYGSTASTVQFGRSGASASRAVFCHHSRSVGQDRRTCVTTCGSPCRRNARGRPSTRRMSAGSMTGSSMATFEHTFYMYATRFRSDLGSSRMYWIKGQAWGSRIARLLTTCGTGAAESLSTDGDGGRH